MWRATLLGTALLLQCISSAERVGSAKPLAPAVTGIAEPPDVAVSSETVDVFPDDFMFGAATSAYQIEGAWDSDGKSESIWDRMTHENASAIADRSSGDVACDSYRLWRRDVEMLRELRVDFYRFSLSWPRLLPEGFSHSINPAGVDYYNRLIDELLRYNITPVVTLYHWDLPQSLQELGGWTSDAMADYFEDYADLAFRLFGDRVKMWVTINEPKQVCLYGYGRATFAPQVAMGGVAEYLCARTVLLAHARACRLYERKYRRGSGRCGLTVHVQWYEPASDRPEDVQAAADATAFEHDMYMHPIFSSTGDWPPLVKQRISKRSQEQGFSRSRLPDFSLEEIALVRGSAHFYGANSYNSFVVRRSSPGQNPPLSYEDDRNADLIEWPKDKQPDEYWAYGLMFDKIRADYDNPDVWVMESGLAGPAGVGDEERARHLLWASRAVLRARQRGAALRGYTAWSLMDNFEWNLGYTLRFGMYAVDFASANRTRVPKTSAFVYRHLASSRRLDLDYRPSPGDTMQPL